MVNAESDVLHGSLALMVLRTLDTWGPQRGWGIARRIGQIGGNVLEPNHGALYPALLRLAQMGRIASKRSASEDNRPAKFYEIMRAGKKQFAIKAETRQRISDIPDCFLRPSRESL